MISSSICERVVVLLATLASPQRELENKPIVVVAEGERFRPMDDKGWRVTQQDDSYASMTFGGMWMTHGACLGAPSASKDAGRMQKVSRRMMTKGS